MNCWGRPMRRLTVDLNSPADPRQGQPAAEVDPRWGRRGQVLVIFAGALIAFMVLMAMVVDIGWYWSNGLKIQRAADAAALAGAVYLPDNFNGPAPNAQTAVLAAAERNGYVPDADTTLTSVVDGNNPRQIDVTISDKVGTFFLKVVGINTLNASRTSKAEFVLPVPMGSPQNYYGVGTFLNLVTPQPAYVTPSSYSAASPTTGLSPSANTQTNTTGPAWTAPANAYTTDGSYATSSTNNSQTAWRGFSFPSFQPGALFDGIVINLNAKVAAGANCQIKSEVSWNAGLAWGNLPRTSSSLTGSDLWYTLGSSTDLTVWGSNHNTWASTDFTTANNFQVRLTYVKNTGCTKVSLDEITAVVYSHTVGTTVETVQTVNGPPAPAVPANQGLTSQGFWGAVITKGGSRENGDQFDPTMDNLKSTSNANFDGKGVDYNVVIAGSSGQVWLFDPTFCETGSEGPGKGSYGTGDHWIGGSPNGVTTVYSLWDQNGTPYDISNDIFMGDSANLFANKIQVDYSASFNNVSYPNSHTGLTDCSNDLYHNKWYRLASGVPAGAYRLNVSTNVSGNDSTNAENMWSAWVTSSSGNSQVYGQGKMVTYNNLVAGNQLFYLAQIDKIHAGKTMEIKLFDPGDVGGDAYLRIKSPDGNAYNNVSNFTYTADNGRSGSGPSIQTASVSGGSLFQDALITIEIPLPTNYGAIGLTPPGEPGAGWWKIEYQVAGGNDTTTWQVDIQGNPVHLLVP
jgi:Flp pilus assembly protein TadG